MAAKELWVEFKEACLCGAYLVGLAKVKNTRAEEIRAMWWEEHSGEGHGRTDKPRHVEVEIISLHVEEES